MDFSEEVESCLQNKDYHGALGLVFNPENQGKVETFGMDLITRLCEFGITECPEIDSLTDCQDMLMHVVRTIRPKEALISLLEQAEIFVHLESNKFVSMLAPLQHVMLNLPKKREHSFSWVLSILNSHIKSQHHFPAKFKKTLMTGRKALVLEGDQKIKDTLLLYKQFCNFYDPFVRQFWIEKNAAVASKDKDALASIHRQQDILRDHLVQLLGDPLLHFDLHWDENPIPQGASPKLRTPASKTTKSSEDNSKSIIKTDPRLIAERLMGFLRLVDPHPEHYLEWSTKKVFLETSALKNKPIYTGDDDDCDDADGDDCVVDFTSVVNYYYLMFVEGLNRDMMSAVLAPSYIFTSAVRLMYPSLSDEKASPVPLLKCLTLSQKLIDNIDDTVPGIRLDAKLLQQSHITGFIESVAYQTVYSEHLPIRKEGLQVLKQLMWKFEPKGRYDFILFVYHRISHDGVKGYITTQLKDCVRIALDHENPEMLHFFTGKSLQRQLRLTCTLKHGVTTDLMENKEQIMCALNLILFLSIRDKEKNRTGLAECIAEIRSKMIEPLYRALELSRAHYQLKLKELDDPKAAEEQIREEKKLTEKLDIMLNNDPLTPESIKISIEEQKKAMNTALGTFDMMNGILARANEVCDAFEKSMKK